MLLWNLRFFLETRCAEPKGAMGDTFPLAPLWNPLTPLKKRL